MFYWLIELSNAFPPGLGWLRTPLNAFRYITFRAAAAIVTALLLSWLLGPWFIRTLRRLSVGQNIRELGPHLLGEDPRQLGKLNRRMDAALKGHAYVKSAIDMACWDLLGKATGLRVSDLLGGTFQEDVPLYWGIGIAEPN